VTAATAAPGLGAEANFRLEVNPAYTGDRGPVNVSGLRTRVAFRGGART
jgi:hypothetical protein